MTFKLVIDAKWGPAVVEGKASYADGQFSIHQWTFGQFIDLSGRLEGDVMSVSGDWGGDYMSGKGGIVGDNFVVSLQPTGNIFSAFIALSVPPSVAARLPHRP